MASRQSSTKEGECRQDPRTGAFLEDQAGVDCGWPLAGMEPGSQRPEWTGQEGTAGYFLCAEQLLIPETLSLSLCRRDTAFGLRSANGANSVQFSILVRSRVLALLLAPSPTEIDERSEKKVLAGRCLTRTCSSVPGVWLRMPGI